MIGGLGGGETVRLKRLLFFRLKKYTKCNDTTLYLCFLNPVSYILQVVMTQVFKLSLFFILVSHLQSARVLNRVLLDDPHALCLDGSPGAYFIS